MTGRAVELAGILEGRSRPEREWMTKLAFLAALAVAAAMVFALGCGDTVLDDAKTEAALEQNLQGAVGKKVTAVECPSGVEVEKGATFDCEVRLAGGGEQTATLKILNEDADVEVTNLGGNK